MCRDKGDGWLGFRNLQNFNLAFLAKQGWRLLHNSHSLFHLVFKAKFFPSSSFLETNVGSNPSFIWTSILTECKVLKKGLRWKSNDARVIRHVWKGSISGRFTVKSAYELLETEGRQQVVGESSRTSELKGLWFSQKKKKKKDLKGLWKKVWKLKVPGRVNFFGVLITWHHQPTIICTDDVFAVIQYVPSITSRNRYPISVWQCPLAYCI